MKLTSLGGMIFYLSCMGFVLFKTEIWPLCILMGAGIFVLGLHPKIICEETKK